MSAGEVFFILIGGVVIGLLGKFVAPGERDRIPLWLTLLCGIGGIYLGDYLYVDVLSGSADTGGVDWLRHGTQILVAAILVMVVATITGRARPKKAKRR